jgi:RecA/RadA recombinase
MEEKQRNDIREALMGDSDEKRASGDYLSTGCDLLDLCVGGAPGVLGFPAGTIINLIGDKSAGKSFLKNEIIAASYHARKGKGFRWFSDDTETGDTFDTTGLYGFNIRPDVRKIGTKEVGDTATVEELDAKVSMFLNSIKEGECGIYAVDSLDGLSDANKEDMAEKRLNQLKQGLEVKDKGDFGMQIAKFLSQHFFKGQHQQIHKKNALLIIVSQIRDNPDAGMFGQKWEVSGGKAMEFYCHTRVFLKTIHKLKKGDRVIGAVVEAETIKSKTPRPFRKVRYTVYFDYGLDNIGSSLDYLFDLRNDKGELITAKADSIAWDGKDGKTLNNLQAWLKDCGWNDECREAKKAKTKNSVLSTDFILEWVEESPERKEALDKKFGMTTDRESLIARIENSKELQAELKARVGAKWEAEEEAVATKRKGKYA